MYVYSFALISLLSVTLISFQGKENFKILHDKFIAKASGKIKPVALD